jgi:uncharacterized protein YdeI (YjbR/CyaY-like superfamily)
MAAFKAHCAFGFWKGEAVVGKGAADESSMGQMGRITRLADLPSDAKLAAWIRKAMKLNEDGVKAPWLAQRRTRPALPVPEDLQVRLQQDPKAAAVFENFAPGKRREYIEWITEAKTAATRTRRLDSALEWIAQGKSRNWKYESC